MRPIARPSRASGEEPKPSEPARSFVSTWRSRGRKRWIIAAAAVVVVSLLFVVLWQAASNPLAVSSNPLVGRTEEAAHPFSLPSLFNSGHDISLSSFRGEPLVINFWASWCVPCRAEMPLLEEAYRAEKGRVRFLGVDSNDTSVAGRPFIQKVHTTYPVVSDASGTVATQYGLFGLPTTVFISPSGRIVGRLIGPMNFATLHRALEEASRG